MTKDKANADIFAQIGAQKNAGEISLVQPAPPLLPEKILPCSENPDSAAFVPTEEPRTPEFIQIEVDRLRNKYLPFLAQLAPEAPKLRTRLAISEFDWKIAKPEDFTDFQKLLSSEQGWQRVSTGHFGPPLGRASTFYRADIELSGEMLQSEALVLHFAGVDYKAHVLFNSYYVGSHEGFFAPFEFQISKYARPGKNVLLVQVDNDAINMGNDSWGEDGKLYEGDKIYAATGPGYDEPAVGWHHCPPGMGIYQHVYIEGRSRIYIHDIFVRPMLESESAELWLEVYNTDKYRSTVSAEVSVYGQNFETVVLENQHYKLPETGPSVNYYRLRVEIPSPRLWDIEAPWLYQMQVVLKDSLGKIVDSQSRHFGMRSFQMDQENEPRGRMFLNGRQIRLRGANTMGFEQQSVMRGDWEQLIDDILLAKVCNMNFWRLTQRPVQDQVYDYCDRLGFLLQTDLPLFGVVRRNQFCETVRQAEEMERLVRNHPSNIMITYINEPLANAWDRPERWLTRPELEALFRNCSEIVRINNPDRVIKPVDGDYDPPATGLPDNHCYNCWYNGHGLDIGKLHRGYWQEVKPGWLYGCGEFGTEGLEDVSTMRAHYPKDWLPQSVEEEHSWLPDRIVQAQTGRFHYMWFETKHALADWVEAGQEHQAWATRIMSGAFRRDCRLNSMAIHLFIDAFPAGWMKSVVDVDRNLKPAFYEYREALKPLIVNLRTDRYRFFSGEQARFEAWVCNDQSQAIVGCTLNWQLEESGNVLQAGKADAEVPVCSSAFQGYIDIRLPEVLERTEFVLRLGLFDSFGCQLHQCKTDITVFAEPALCSSSVIALGTDTGPAHVLLSALDCPSSEPDQARCIVIDSIEEYKSREPELLALAQIGASLLLLQLPEGEHTIAGTRVIVETTGMGSRHFVSRDSGHSLVRDFLSEDFKFWFDEDLGYVSPFLHSTFEAPNWTEILAAGNGNWEGGWKPALAAAELRVGQGCVRICQIDLHNRCKTNPIASIFAARLLQE